MSRSFRIAAPATSTPTAPVNCAGCHSAGIAAPAGRAALPVPAVSISPDAAPQAFAPTVSGLVDSALPASAFPDAAPPVFASPDVASAVPASPSAAPPVADLVDSALAAQGFSCRPLPFYALGRELITGPFPLGSSLAARFGHIYIQDASSMLPALALAAIAEGDAGTGTRTGGPSEAGTNPGEAFAAPAPGEGAGTGPVGAVFAPLPVLDDCGRYPQPRSAEAASAPLLVLDMCASPGGKTSLLAALLGPRALVLGNEPGQKRLATLRRNLELMNVFNSATVSHQGQELPLPSAQAPAGEGGAEDGFAGFDYILLDPPCSGWGTVEKNPRVTELWQGERLGPLVGLQRLLLREAARLLRPGGALVYSTCTTNVQENEEQIAWSLEDLNAEAGGALELLPLAPFPGFEFEAPHAPLIGSPVLRVPLGGELGQGFFIAALRKGAGAPVISAGQAGKAAAKFAGKPGRKPGGKPPATARAVAFQTVAPQAVAPEALASPLCDLSLLPPGEIHEQGGMLYFKHRAGLRALPPGFAWRGFPLGRNMRLDGGLRGLMPPPDAARAAGAAVLDAADPAQVLALVSGQSLRLETGQSEAGLYLNGLPLCRLKARGGRVFI